jgi:hypothetical protein
MPSVFVGKQVLPANSRNKEYGKVWSINREYDVFYVIIGPMEPIGYSLSKYEKTGKLSAPGEYVSSNAVYSNSEYSGGKKRRHTRRKSKRHSRKTHRRRN